ncbi:hypothetical protein AB4Y44_33435 [Paraburkholderia sp. BR10937]|uniref:hypothetical protein n=1 Tax=Paraburkholderia sp. BR10937 TaxID=3236994 RepID=UPI0034D23B11
MSKILEQRRRTRNAKAVMEQVKEESRRFYREATVGLEVTVVVGRGPQGQEDGREKAKIRAVTDEHIFVENLESPFDRRTGVCKTLAKKGLDVWIELESEREVFAALMRNPELLSEVLAI